MRQILLFTLVVATTAAVAQADSTRQKRARVTPLPVVYYSPETRLGFGALVAANFETHRDSITRSSYAQTYFLYTINKQYDWGTLTRIYGRENKFVFQGKFNYTYFPEYYYGIATENPEAHKDTIEYDRIGADLRMYWKLKRHYFLGVAALYNHIGNVASDDGTLTNDKPLGYNGYWIGGVAPAFAIETRDNYVYPRRGFFLEAMYYVFPAWNGHSYYFRSFRLDVRKYFPLKLIGSLDVLALQLTANLNGGDVPFKDMADIGGSYTMRGYYKGFYRYNNLYTLQAEFRTMIWRWLGATAWVGGALTSDYWYRPFDHAIKPNAGIGLRVMINKKDRLNIRVDQGFGNKGQNGFYLDIAEAY